MREIIQNGHETLRKIAHEIPADQIQSKKFQTLIADMKEALDSQSDGVAIAAPQIAEPWRAFVVSKKVFIKENDDDHNISLDDQVFINPVLTKKSRRKKWMEGEGCLSVRWKYGEVKRHTHVTVEAYNEQGEKFIRGAGGLLAHIFQHEIDHLDGVLFIDKARDIKDVPPEEAEQYRKIPEKDE